MATLTGQFISQSYGGVIQLSTNTGIVTGSNTQLQDGFGTNLGVWINGQGRISGSAITSSGDSRINSITIGRGSSNISTNTAIGSLTLGNNIAAGTANTAVGAESLRNNTSGSGNTAVGYLALNLNTIGGENTAIGKNTLGSNTTGIDNTAVGDNALAANTIGSNNTAVGCTALSSTTIGERNVAVGLSALGSNITGSDNVAIGNGALFSNKGSRNTAVGDETAYNITNGVNNTIIGYSTGYGITTGDNNTIVGASVTGLSSSLSNNIILSDGAGNIRARYSGSWTLDGVVNTTASYSNYAQTASFALNIPSLSNIAYTTASNDFTAKNTFSGSVNHQVRTLTVASNTASIDLSLGNIFTLSLANGTTYHISASNIQRGSTVALQVTQGTFGTGQLTFGSGFSFPSGSSYIAFASASAVDIITFISFDGTKLSGVASNNFI